MEKLNEHDKKIEAIKSQTKAETMITLGTEWIATVDVKQPEKPGDGAHCGAPFGNNNYN
jgi:hypothetical protein